jgi:transcriptional regulator with XRE-family HTH domain
MAKFKPTTEAELAAQLGPHLKAMRGELSQGAVTQGADVAPRAYLRWETGQRLPSLRKLLDLANFHKVPVKELLP